MKRVCVDPHHPDPEILKKAGEFLLEGKLVVFPTETVYGLGASALDEQALDRVYRIKNRSKDKPLSYHFADLKDFYAFAGEGIDARQKEWFEKLIPNPVTLVYKDSIRNRTLGVRFPENVIAREIIRFSKCPVIATSANFSGEPSGISVEEMSEAFLYQVDFIVDAGVTDRGQESTVLDISGKDPVILRQGVFHL